MFNPSLYLKLSTLVCQAKDHPSTTNAPIHPESEFLFGEPVCTECFDNILHPEWPHVETLHFTLNPLVYDMLRPMFATGFRHMLLGLAICSIERYEAIPEPDELRHTGRRLAERPELLVLSPTIPGIFRRLLAEIIDMRVHRYTYKANSYAIPRDDMPGLTFQGWTVTSDMHPSLCGKGMYVPWTKPTPTAFQSVFVRLEKRLVQVVMENSMFRCLLRLKGTRIYFVDGMGSGPAITDDWGDATTFTNGDQMTWYHLERLIDLTCPVTVYGNFKESARELGVFASLALAYPSFTPVCDEFNSAHQGCGLPSILAMPY